MPNGQGFDSSFGHMGGCIDNDSHFFYWNGPNRHDLWRNGREVWAVRQGDWKLIGNPRDTSNSDARKRAPVTAADRLFLVNLAEDVSEMKNLAKNYPDVVKRYW